MNEIKICPSVPYSIFSNMTKDFIEKELYERKYVRLRTLLEFITDNYCLFDSDLKSYIISEFEEFIDTFHNRKPSDYDVKQIKDCLKWCQTNRNNTRPTTRPLNDYLPVVDPKLIKQN